MPVKQLSDGNPDGCSLGQSSTDLVSFYNATPVVQPSGASQAAITDNSGGTASATTGVVANAFKQTIRLGFALADLTTSTTRKVAVPFAFTLNSVGIRTGTAATTSSKAATLTAQISGVACTGGVISATSANQNTTGVLTAGTTITAGNTGTAGQTLEVAVSSVTAFVEGTAEVEFNVTNNDLANAVATIIAQGNAKRTALVNTGLIKGSA